MRIAAIDVGSNAARIQISAVIEGKGVETRYKKIEYVRYPLRLGKDVFKIGKISSKRKTKFIKLMQTFRLLMELYDVDEYSAYATSAMREAENSAEIVREIFNLTGICLEVIDGTKEASILNTALTDHMQDDTFVHIDVGGGSTELNIHHKNQFVKGQSFKIGSVRYLDHEDSVWEEMKNWLSEHLPKDYNIITAVGTGGNINKLSQLIQKKKPEKSDQITEIEMRTMQSELASFELDDRIYQFSLNSDRADVIIPASDIYLSVMEMAGIQNMIVPNVGLKDGMIRALHKEILNN
ncbi:Ppx/GppA phosphatase family protein [Aureibacter tunicatorum]|uniref:Exopolyphosphatase/guanosine-5'-triphosphate, 3'-diphosphate pyrophosphatase n=1 Tax=Aureibacter tunicatorum TaxID=866807 RepID=A0AAE3XLR8_9BACT|nr:phosphatase [Aureibacter tunicatorum]MDR6238111.1 exopolyphosphatase/guanosine-5'-triphosphate,3'-diphosphate pyrophosphatase [Aureibacter tunicatorum]BDD03144.1 exopolyphosphatase [Aureibacter tunicatorum]